MGAVVVRPARRPRRAPAVRRRRHRARRASDRVEAGSCSPTARRAARRHRASSASARIPNVEWLEGSGLALGNGVVCGAGGDDQPAGRRRRRRLRRVADDPLGRSTSGSSTGPARWSDPRGRGRHAAGRRAATARTRPAVLLVRPVRRRGSSSPAPPGTATRSRSRTATAASAASWPSTGEPAAGRRARHGPAPAVHPLAPAARRRRPRRRDPSCRTAAGLGARDDPVVCPARAGPTTTSPKE